MTKWQKIGVYIILTAIYFNVSFDLEATQAMVMAGAFSLGSIILLLSD